MDRREYLFQRKNRCVGRIMSDLERNVFPKLTGVEQKQLRSLIRTQLSSYHDDALEALEMERSTQINALAIKARDIHDSGKRPNQHPS